ncbi:hypothetical protein JOM56_008002 [Amanita muscaria]
MNNVQPSPLMTQQTPSHAHSGQAHHTGNLAVSNIQQSLTMSAEVPTWANYSLALVENENTNMYSRVSDGKWGCNIGGCRYTSRFKRDIKRHCSNLGHGGSRDHECEFCGRAFGRKDVLKRHIAETGCWLRWLASITNTA